MVCPSAGGDGHGRDEVGRFWRQGGSAPAYLQEVNPSRGVSHT